MFLFLYPRYRVLLNPIQLAAAMAQLYKEVVVCTLALPVQVGINYLYVYRWALVRISLACVRVRVDISY